MTRRARSAVRRFRRRAFAGRAAAYCGWCDRLLVDRPGPHQATTEHVVPRAMGGGDDDANLAVACHDCQRERAALSGLRCELLALLNGGADLGGWLRRRAGLLDLLLKWERLYHERLSGEARELCLAEIDDVLEPDADP